MVNPYASEDFNRIRVNPRDRKAEGDVQSVPHPLMEGKKLDISPNELKAFTKAMEQQEFKSLLNDYVGEISDPKHRPELDQYLNELEERGELPPGAALIQPLAGFCLKTTGKRLQNESQKKFFDQKTFINICWHEFLEQPKQETMTQPNGQQGTSWSLPYRVSKGKPDQDAKGQLCMTYDAVFHPDVAKFCVYPEFKKFCADTAIDGVNRVVAENKEKVSTDYKILKHINCKGERPNKMLVKTQKTQQNELLKNMDMSKTESRLQKDIEKIVEENKKKEEEKKLLELEKQDRLKESQFEIEDEIDEGSGDEKPAGIIQPKFKVVHSYPVDLGDSWEGHKDSAEGQNLKKAHKLPTELTVTIYVKYIESMKQATLDINDNTLMFKYPEVYYLDINLMYKVDKSQGNAKFDKSKKTLTVRVPVIGSTDDSQRVLDQHYREFKEAQDRRLQDLKNLQKSKIDDEMESRRQRKKGAQTASTADEDEADVVEDQENQSSNQINDFIKQYEEAGSGVSKPKVLMAGSTTSQIDDKYNVQSEIDKSSEVSEKRDLNTIKREEFLTIVKDSNSKGVNDEEDGEPDLQKDGIKFKQDDFESKFKLKTSQQDGKKPLITELGSGSVANSEPSSSVKNQEVEVPFSWTDAKRIELKPQFIAQADYVFLNLPLKGYNRDEDVRYALSSDEFLLEVRDRTAPKGVSRVRRLCQTLTKQIDVPQSEVMLLVDFVSVKLCKLERGLTWSGFGYDIADFTIPERGQMKSNFLKVPQKPVPVPQVVPSVEQPVFTAPLEPEIQLTEEEKLAMKEAEIERLIERQQMQQQTYLNLDTDTIYLIY